MHSTSPVCVSSGARTMSCVFVRTSLQRCMLSKKFWLELRHRSLRRVGAEWLARFLKTGRQVRGAGLEDWDDGNRCRCGSHLLGFLRRTERNHVPKLQLSWHQLMGRDELKSGTADSSAHPRLSDLGTERLGCIRRLCCVVYLGRTV
jgi:hypothetical protein